MMVSARFAVVAAGLLWVFPALAGEITAEEARRVAVGKLFSYTCFEGTTGAGRVRADGSVAGTIRFQGNGPVRYLSLPPGTLHISGNRICASMKGLLFQPCFRLVRLGANTYRGSIAGLGFAYCDFRRRGGRVELARAANGLRGSRAAVASPPQQ